MGRMTNLISQATMAMGGCLRRTGAPPIWNPLNFPRIILHREFYLTCGPGFYSPFPKASLSLSWRERHTVGAAVHSQITLCDIRCLISFWPPSSALDGLPDSPKWCPGIPTRHQGSSNLLQVPGTTVRPAEGRGESLPVVVPVLT
jgi:hypothetical protein